MDILHKSLPVYEVKVLDEAQGVVEMFVSVYDVPDSYNERMIFSCFAESLAEKLPSGLFMHNWEMPVAKTLVAQEIPAGDLRLPQQIRKYGGLYIKAEYNLDTQRGKESFSDIKKGVVDEFSIGYKELKSVWNTAEGLKDVLKVKLYEWSSVIRGANPATFVVSAKSEGSVTSGKDVFDKVKAEYLGETAEESLCFNDLMILAERLIWRCGYEACYGTMSKADRIQMFGYAIDEYKALCTKVLSLLLPEGEVESEKFEDMKLEVTASAPVIKDFAFGTNAQTALTSLRDAAIKEVARFDALGTLRAKDRQKEGRVFSQNNYNSLTDIFDTLESVTEKGRELLSSAKPQKAPDLRLIVLKAQATK